MEEERKRRVESLRCLTESTIILKRHRVIEDAGPSSILDIKAKLCQTQELAKKNQDFVSDVEFRGPKKEGSDNIFSQKNLGVEARVKSERKEAMAMVGEEKEKEKEDEKVEEEEEETPTQQQQVLELRLTVDKRKGRVVYAECGREMADVLFSFLTTPVAALVRRTGKDSGLGRMDSLYRSVEELDAYHFRTPACRDLLLRPRSAFGFPHRRLKIRINDAEEVFTCACASRKCPDYSLFPGAKCECGLDMDAPMPFSYPPPRTSSVVFLREDRDSFVVTDDLFIAPSSDALKRNLCYLAGVDLSSCGSLEERIVLVDNDQIVQLMKSSLLSNTPLTDTFLPSNFVTKPIHWPLEFLQQHLAVNKEENLCVRIVNKLRKDLLSMLNPILGRRKMAVSLFHNQKRVVFAKVERDFIDILFSFLTFPFGSIIAAVGGCSSLGCLDNLHKVVNRFISDGHFYSPKSSPKWYGYYLLDPPVAHHHSCENHLLKIGRQPFPVHHSICEFCHDNGFSIRCRKSQHTHFELKPINPKYKEKRTTKKGRGYMRWPETFVITSSLAVKPTYLSEKYLAMGLEEKLVFVGQQEVLKLLMACLRSEDPFTDVFLHAEMD